MLWSILYRSRINMPLETVPAELRSIKQACLRNNPRGAITGCLIQRDEWLAQVLEGSCKSISATYSRIAADPRHTDIELLQAGPLSYRHFDQFSMLLIEPSGFHVPILAKFASSGMADLGALTAVQLLDLMAQLTDDELHRFEDIVQNTFPLPSQIRW